MNYYVRKGESKRFEIEKSFRFERENDFKKAFMCVCALIIRRMIFKSSNGKGKKENLWGRIAYFKHMYCVRMYYSIALGSHSRTHTFIRNPMAYIKYRWHRERNVFEQEEYPVFLWLCTVRPSCRYVLHTFKGSHASTDVCVCAFYYLCMFAT